MRNKVKSICHTRLVANIMPRYCCEHHTYIVLEGAGAYHKITPDDLVAQSQRDHDEKCFACNNTTHDDDMKTYHTS